MENFDLAKITSLSRNSRIRKRKSYQKIQVIYLFSIVVLKFLKLSKILLKNLVQRFAGRIFLCFRLPLKKYYNIRKRKFTTASQVKTAEL